MGSVSSVVHSTGGVVTGSVEITIAEDGSSKAVMQAQTMFIRLGQRRGLIAMQRIRKGGLSSLLHDHVFV